MVNILFSPLGAGSLQGENGKAAVAGDDAVAHGYNLLYKAAFRGADKFEHFIEFRAWGDFRFDPLDGLGCVELCPCEKAECSLQGRLHPVS